MAVTAAAFHLALGWNMEQQDQITLKKSWAHSSPHPTMERIAAHISGQGSLTLWVWNSDWSSAPHSAVLVPSLRLQVTSLHVPLLLPSATRPVFVLTCVLLVPGGCMTASQEKGVERGSEPVAFIEHMGKAVLSAVLKKHPLVFWQRSWCDFVGNPDLLRSHFWATGSAASVPGLRPGTEAVL